MHYLKIVQVDSSVFLHPSSSALQKATVTWNWLRTTVWFYLNDSPKKCFVWSSPCHVYNQLLWKTLCTVLTPSPQTSNVLQ